MKKTTEILLCDRCKKELEKANEIYDDYTQYDLCDECNEVYKEYSEKVRAIEEQYKELQKKYKFGRYMFVEDIDERF